MNLRSTIAMYPLFSKPDNHVTIWEFVQDICLDRYTGGTG